MRRAQVSAKIASKHLDRNVEAAASSTYVMSVTTASISETHPLVLSNNVAASIVSIPTIMPVSNATKRNVLSAKMNLPCIMEHVMTVQVLKEAHHVMRRMPFHARRDTS